MFEVILDCILSLMIDETISDVHIHKQRKPLRNALIKFNLTALLLLTVLIVPSVVLLIKGLIIYSALLWLISIPVFVLWATGRYRILRKYK